MYRINGFFRRLKRYGFINRTITLSELLTKSDYMLICKMSLPGHSLHHLLPPCRNSVNLRARGHRFELHDFNTLHKKSFIIRSLYKFAANLNFGIVLFLGFIGVRECLHASVCQTWSKSAKRLRRYRDLTDFQDGGRRHLGFS